MRHSIFLNTAGALAAVIALAACSKPADTTAPAADTAATTPPAAPPDAAAPAAASTTAAGFVSAAAISDMYEIAAGKIAASKAKSAEVKTFAARMVHDHSATTAALKKIIAGPGMSVTAPTGMNDFHKGLIDALNAATPADFDKTYMDQQVAGHDEAVTLFSGYANGGDNDALKTFASSTLPKIQEHDDMAKKIQAGLK